MIDNIQGNARVKKEKNNMKIAEEKESKYMAAEKTESIFGEQAFKDGGQSIAAWNVFWRGRWAGLADDAHISINEGKVALPRGVCGGEIDGPTEAAFGTLGLAKGL